MRRIPTEENLEQARLLTNDETERLLSRMRAKLMRRLEDKKLSAVEAAAIQLEIENEELNEWREKMLEIRKKSKTR